MTETQVLVTGAVERSGRRWCKGWRSVEAIVLFPLTWRRCRMQSLLW